MDAASRDTGTLVEKFFGCCFSGVSPPWWLPEMPGGVFAMYSTASSSLEAMSDLTCLLVVKCHKCFSQICCGSINA